MTYEELQTEAQRLARPSVQLVAEGDRLPVGALWGEPPEAMNDASPLRHRLTVATSCMPEAHHAATGLSVFTNDRDLQGGVVLPIDFDAAAAAYRGKMLFAKPAVSFPPLEGVFLFGDQAVQEWLKELGWEASWGYNANFPDPEIGGRYEKAYQHSCPLYCEGVYAILGGWHFPWPDEDWQELSSAELLVWTLQDAEPWVEVWRRGGAYQVIERIT